MDTAIDEVSSLALAWRTREGGGGKTERRYLDFIINDVSLGDVLDAGDVIGCLGWGVSKHDEEQVQALLLKQPSPLETGRVMVYVCAKCGDIGCGAVTASVEKMADHFVWKDFGYENDYDGPDLRPYKHVGPFRFVKADYWRTLSQRPKA